MTSYHARYDPVYYSITTAMEGCSYGKYKDYVVQEYCDMLNYIKTM